MTALTDEQIETARERYKRGVPPAAIAHYLRVDVNEVRKVVCPKPTLYRLEKFESIPIGP